MKTVSLTHQHRAVAIFMALLLAFTLFVSANPAIMAPAYADDGGGATGDIWDIVGSDGRVDEDNDTINNTTTGGSAATLISKYKTIATAISGVLTITMLIFLLIQISKLGAAGDNDVARKKAIMGILTTGLATALFGGVTIVVGFFWNILKGD